MPYISGAYSAQANGLDRVNLERLGRIVNLTATIGPNGPSAATLELAVPPGLDHKALRPGRILTLTAGGAPWWRGTLQTPQRGDPWTIQADGTVIAAKSYVALGAGGADPAANYDTTIDTAIARGLPWTRVGSPIIPQPTAGSAQNTTTAVDTDLDTLLAQAELLNGQTHYVDPNGQLTSYPPPTTATLSLVVDVDAGAFTVEDFANVLIVSFYDVATATLNTGTITSSNAGSIAQLGRVERVLDLTALGLITSAMAQSAADNLIGQTSAGYALTGTFTVPAGALLTYPGAVPVDPRFVTPQTRVALMGAQVPSYVQANPFVPFTFRLGQVDWAETTQTATLTPYASSGNDLSSLLRPEPAPNAITY